MPRKSPSPRLPSLAPVRPLSPISPLGTTYRTSPVSPLTPSPPLFRPVQVKSPESTPVQRATQCAQAESHVPTSAPVPTQPKAEHIPIPLVQPERPQTQTSHSSVNVLPQRREWSDPALEAQIARKVNEHEAQRELYILIALVFVLGMIFLIVWLSVSHA